VEEIVERILEESLRVKDAFVRENASRLVRLAEKIAYAFASDRKLLLCGNGGSAADAQHIAAEFVNRYRLERPPLPAIALTTDTSVLTSIGNDYSFEDVFSKQVKALGTEGDVLLAISTSGSSQNVLSAVKDARKLGIYTAGFCGGDGGPLAPLVDLGLVVKNSVTARVQEAHIVAGHILCHLVDYILFESHLTKEQGNR
jgi:D-sedoheptulose 7-phosphate isomerase